MRRETIKSFGGERPLRSQCNPPKSRKPIEVIINQDGICKKSDKDIIWGALMAKCRQLERMLKKKYQLSKSEYLALKDEYERTFALTEKYRRDS